ncbi:MAG: DUF4254 domain-containing protein [Tatlockia sp.]|jgi:hypothetical protein
MTFLIQVADIATLQSECIIRWKANGVDFKHSNFLALVEENHAFNFQLWQAEDKARREDMGFEFVYRAKRLIDKFNQERNNRMEAMDSWLYETLKPAPATHCPVHSETPGMMIDRLSILALKAYHMHLQTGRLDVEETHRQNCEQKYQVILLQQKQLQHCLQQLIDEVQSKTRSFRVYHQFKMYNDPTLNSELYAQQPGCAL